MKPYYDHEGITIYHADCREVLPSIQADVMVTDPPYGIAYRSGRSSPLFGDVAARYQTGEGAAIQGDADTSIRDDILARWRPSPAMVFASPRVPFLSGYKAALVWDKGEAFGMGDLTVPWKPNWELIFVFGVGFRGPRTGAVLQGYVPPRIAMGRCHPNQKPVALMRQLLLKCPHAWTVIDPFMGSGSTLMAVKGLGRKAIGIEIDEKYCEIAAKRLAQGCLDFEETA